MKFKKSLNAVIVMLVVLCFGAIMLTGCGENEEEKFTVDIARYNMAQGNVSVDYSGQEATITVTANEGYILESFTVDDEDKLASLIDGVYKIVLQKDVVVAVGFKREQTQPEAPTEEKFNVTIESGENGSITLSSDKTSFKKGESATAVLRPSKGYEIESFFVDGEDYTEKALLDGEYTFKVSKDVTVKATFTTDDLTKVRFVSAKGVKRIFENYEYVLVDFWATWCNACIQTDPEMKSVAEENLGIKIVKMDLGPATVADTPERKFFCTYTQKYGNYNTVPALVIFKNGEFLTGSFSTYPFGYKADTIRAFITENVK